MSFCSSTENEKGKMENIHKIKSENIFNIICKCEINEHKKVCVKLIFNQFHVIFFFDERN